MWLPLHYLVQYLHSCYFSHVFLFVSSTTVCAQGFPVALNCLNWIASGFQGVPVSTNHCM